MKNDSFSSFRKFFASSVLLLISAGVFAQANFSGTWSFNESKSNFGESQFRFAAISMTVTQNAATLTVESTMRGRDGEEFKSTSKYNLDGTVSENPMFNTTRKSTAVWSADNTSLTITSIMTFERDGQSREIKSTETWKLSEGGKVLMLETVRPGRDGGEMKTAVAYDKK
jgi:hypothetical protein